MTAREVRLATHADLALVGGIEDAADRLLTDLLHATGFGAAATGQARAATPGFVLVAAERPGGVPIGFVHVLEVDVHAHLEQVSVLPEHGRRGHGRALVEAAKREAHRRGHDRMTLRTFAEVPWNAPFYGTCGFVESQAESPFHVAMLSTEAEAGLDRWGRRVQMTASLP